MARKQLTELLSSGEPTNLWNEKTVLPPQEPYSSSAIRFDMSLIQYRWCMEMLSNGLDGRQAAKTIGIDPEKVTSFLEAIQRNKNVKRFLANMHSELEEKVEITLEWKYRKLKHIIEVCLPDNTVAYDRNLVAPQIALAAIAELNKMNGHYAATKTEVVSTIPPEELEHLKQLVEKFAIEHKKEY